MAQIKVFAVTVELPAFQAGQATDFSTGRGSPCWTLGFMGINADSPAIHVPTALLRDTILALRGSTSALAHQIADGYQAVLAAQVG